MTMLTSWFEIQKQNGKVEKLTKGLVVDGKRTLNRTIYRVGEETFARINGNIYPVRQSSYDKNTWY